jgi:hypothetical protein
MPTSSQITAAIQVLCPGAQWSLRYNADGTWSLTWHDVIQVQPTIDEINAQIAAQGK